LGNVISRAIPGGMALIISVLGVYFYYRAIQAETIPNVSMDQELFVTMCVLALSYTGIVVLAKICEPFNVFRVFVFLISIALMTIAAVLGKDEFGIITPKAEVGLFTHMLFVFGIVLLSYFVITLIMKILRALKVMYD
jgi:hypothetical protein